MYRTPSRDPEAAGGLDLAQRRAGRQGGAGQRLGPRAIVIVGRDEVGPDGGALGSAVRG